MLDIDARTAGNVARFINDGDEAEANLQAVAVLAPRAAGDEDDGPRYERLYKIYLFSRRVIQPGEPLTVWYGPTYDRHWAADAAIAISEDAGGEEAPVGLSPAKKAKRGRAAAGCACIPGSGVRDVGGRLELRLVIDRLTGLSIGLDKFLDRL